MAEANSNTTPQFHDYLMQSVVEGLLVINRQGSVVFANPAAAAILGYEPDALIGKHYELFWPEDVPSPDKINSGDTWCNETKLRHQNGRFVPVAMIINPISTETINNKLVSIIGLADIQRFNEALSNTEKLAGIGTLTASVAHELNTPISIITAACSNLLHEVDDNNLSVAQLLHYIEMIEQSAWRCARIVGVLRNYTVEDAPQSAVTDLNIIVEDAVIMVQYQFKGDFNVTVETDLQSGLKSIVCDHNRLTQVLINLLANARDAMQPDGGKIQIKTWMVSEKSNGEEQFAFSVRDTGHGIPSGMIDRIFDPFFTTKPNGRGTGLGLFVSRRIVTQHNGRIWAQNNPDGGTTFTVTLPRKQSSVSSHQLTVVS